MGRKPKGGGAIIGVRRLLSVPRISLHFRISELPVALLLSCRSMRRVRFRGTLRSKRDEESCPAKFRYAGSNRWKGS